jgi:hypothetical protein
MREPDRVTLHVLGRFALVAERGVKAGVKRAVKGGLAIRAGTL